MSRSLALFAIGLVFGGGIGLVTAAGNGVTFDGHDHGDPAHHGGGSQAEMAAHDHSAMVNMAAGPEAPALEIALTPDPMSGWNLHAMPQNFRFAPENASGADLEGEGHAHVYVNGEKIGRLYGRWMHIGTLPEGEVEVKVSLNSNSHGVIAVDGNPVEAAVTVDTR
ncbi:hypothetical protein R1T40_10695 [Tritonibacter scottomollicae]|uniref:Uncharacterized protein n=1 Tax=Tritonibacter scottomollicae TaxID=483013 RepID=A0ABZ0HLX2_TRISK|nr:hypothetical protein [Tritonibacter scottomollicae]WOI35164.1 hypothetical protein R1T40_10695 [Tritonibacter scottomollicae]